MLMLSVFNCWLDLLLGTEWKNLHGEETRVSVRNGNRREETSNEDVSFIAALIRLRVRRQLPL